MSLGDYYVGTHSLDLSQFQFAPGTYQVFVKAVGKPSIRNNMSAPAAYTVAIQGPPVAVISTPSNGQHAGPATNLEWHRTVRTAPSSLTRSTSMAGWSRRLAEDHRSSRGFRQTMGLHHFVVKAEDATQQWGTALVWDQRTY